MTDPFISDKATKLAMKINEISFSDPYEPEDVVDALLSGLVAMATLPSIPEKGRIEVINSIVGRFHDMINFVENHREELENGISFEAQKS